MVRSSVEIVWKYCFFREMNVLINDFYDCVNLDCICVILNLEIMLLIYEY